jgi:putative two-component system response regulator
MKHRVLLVDDDAAFRSSVARVLTQAGMDVVHSVGGVDALRLLEHESFDVAVVDMMMPEMDGLALTRLLRLRPATARLPILFLTGLQDLDKVEEAFEAGGDDYIAKPPRGRELVARTRAAAERYRVVRDLDDAETILELLARSVEAKDGTTADHCDRLAHVSVVLGRALGLGTADLEALRRGGVMHDIGKIGIPDAILLKPGKLDAEEWQVMRNHVKIGAALLSPLRTMERALAIVRYHHERYDGTGYLEGLTGEAIPLLARVFQVCDVFDALTSERPYKKAFSMEEAARIIEEETARGWWDPRIVAAFVRIIRTRPESLRRPGDSETTEVAA